MNDTPESGWEREMSHEFDRRVRDLHEAPLTLDTVKGKAATIRRRRRAAVAGAVLATAAVVTPVALLVGDALGDADTRIDPADPAPTDPGYLGVDYLEGATYHRAEGDAFELPAATYLDAATVGDRVLATRNGDDPNALVVDVIDADGVVVDTYRSWGFPVTSASGDLVAFIDTAGALRVVWDGGDAVLTQGRAVDDELAAVTGGPTCGPESDCRVFVDDGDGPPVVITAAGESSEPVPDIIGINAATDDGLLSVVTRFPDDYSSCGGVYDETTREYEFQSCEHAMLDVSPDGRHVVTVPSTTEGAGASSLAILDLDGQVVASYSPPAGWLPGHIVWQDDEHVLTPAYDDRRRTWQIVRVGLDGSSEVVAGPVSGDMETARFQIAG